VSRTGRRSRRSAALPLAAALLAGVYGVSACGTTQAGAAAVVGDRRITVDDLQTATTQIRSIVSQPDQVTQQLVLSWLIANPYVVQVASENNRGVSREDATRFFTQAGFKDEQGGGNTPSDPAVTAVQTAYALQLLTGQGSTPEVAQKSVNEIIAMLKAADVRVSPRYGTFSYAWDAQTQSFPLTPRNPNWLPTPTPSPSPAPS
jgi:hypothetical protein